ncbi:MAG: T9SS type A sorting domain-containing protein [Saprospiraceae bacterium]|nr:T9SS type A sorting domain-containing protein [Saprospiraceae bacterium]
MKHIQINTLRLLMLLLAGILCSPEVSAQGWRTTFGFFSGPGPYAADGNYITGVQLRPDSSFWVVVNTPESDAGYFLGNFPNSPFGAYGGNPHLNSGSHFAKSSLLTAGDTLLVLKETIPKGGGQRNLALAAYSWIGLPANLYTQHWNPIIFAGLDQNAFAHSLIATSDGGLLVLGSVEPLAGGQRDLLLVKTTADAQPLWSKLLATPDSDLGAQVLEAADGGFFILKTRQPLADPLRREAWLLKTDANGDLLWETNLSGSGSDEGFDLIATADGNLVVSGTNRVGDDAFLMKVDLAGAVLWRQDVLMPGRSAAGRCVLEDAQGDLVLCGLQVDSSSQQAGILLMKCTAAGAPLWERFIVYKDWRTVRVDELALCADGGFLLGASIKPPNGDPLAYLLRTDLNGIIKPAMLAGNVFRDFDLDCTQTTGDQALENWVVEAFQDSSKIFYANTDALGNYRLECDTGNYTVRVILPVDYWKACANNIPVYLGYQDTLTLDFPLQDSVDCPYLTVDHATSLVRPCDTTFFTVSYCNLGPSTAAGAYLELSLDDLFTFLFADITPTVQPGNVLSFPLGDIPSGECGSFQVAALVDCSAELGTVACSEAHTFPDSLCLPTAPNWSGAQVQVEGICNGDSVHFILTNTGIQPMPAALDYIIIEDAVLLMQGDFQLDGLESINIPLEATGSTYHLLAQQEPLAPGNSLPLAAVEGCAGNGGPISLGFFNQFSLGNESHSVSVDCPVVRNAYDPNDKQGLPTGFDDEHYIFDNTDLEYTIRFQNTGNDTAFRVVLLDTLSAFLDPATVLPGAASHPYRFELEENGVLRFTFADIQLPDSTTNFEGSQGYVHFRVAQKPHNPAGTRIENRAGIYFNFNLPVLTNTVFHTIHEPFFEVTTLSPVLPGHSIAVSAYPNPFSEQLRIEISGLELPDLQFDLYNTSGQLVRTLPLQQQQALLQREGLAPGLYWFTLRSGAQLVGSGKVVVR